MRTHEAMVLEGEHKSSRCSEELPGWCPVRTQHEYVRPVKVFGNKSDRISVFYQATGSDASGHKMITLAY